MIRIFMIHNLTRKELESSQLIIPFMRRNVFINYLHHVCSNNDSK